MVDVRVDVCDRGDDALHARLAAQISGGAAERQRGVSAAQIRLQLLQQIIRSRREDQRGARRQTRRDGQSQSPAEAFRRSGDDDQRFTETRRGAHHHLSQTRDACRSLAAGRKSRDAIDPPRPRKTGQDKTRPLQMKSLMYLQCCVYVCIYLANKLNKTRRYKLTTNTTGDRK